MVSGSVSLSEKMWIFSTWKKSRKVRVQKPRADVLCKYIIYIRISSYRVRALSRNKKIKSIQWIKSRNKEDSSPSLRCVCVVPKLRYSSKCSAQGEGVVYANAYDIKKKPPEIRVVSDKHLIPRLFTSYL